MIGATGRSLSDRIEANAPIPTWFNVGGRADRLVRPENAAELRECIRTDPDLRILGDGANLLVDDAGVAELVVSLDRGTFSAIECDPRTGRVVAGAGAKLPRLVNEASRAGLTGVEGLGGIPATIGGAAAMNAGGRFGEFSQAIVRVHALDRTGRAMTLDRDRCAFGYRTSALSGLVVTAVELSLAPDDPARTRARLKEVMEYKRDSQPLADHSAGCCFRNPTLQHAIDGVGEPGRRISAGLLIDRSGCKGLSVGGARVSERHANFLVTRAGCRARDVLRLMEEVQRRVLDAFGVAIEPEVVVWRRRSPIDEMAR